LWYLVLFKEDSCTLLFCKWENPLLTENYLNDNYFWKFVYTQFNIPTSSFSVIWMFITKDNAKQFLSKGFKEIKNKCHIGSSILHYYT